MAPVRGEDGDADEETPAASRRRASEKEDEDENEEADEENREGKLRFAGIFFHSSQKETAVAVASKGSVEALRSEVAKKSPEREGGRGRERVG